MKKKILAMIMVSAMTLGMMTGCGSNTNTSVTPDETEAVTPDETEAEEIVEPETEVATEEPTEIETETEVEVETETEEPTEVVEEPVEEAPAYTYTDMSATKYAKSSVNVRDLPSTDGTKLGGLSQNQEVSVTGQCNETGWYRIDYNGSVGYVSGSYLVDTKVEVPVAAAPAADTASAPAAEATASVAPPFPYPVNTIIDNGGTDVYVYYLRRTRDGQVTSSPDDLLRQVDAILYDRVESDTFSCVTYPVGGGLNDDGEYAEGYYFKYAITN